MHYLLIYDVVDDYVERRAPLRALHLELARQAVARAELVLGGALANPADGAVLLFKGDSPKSAEAFAAADPYVLNGLVKQWRVREWTTVIGGDAEAAPAQSPAQLALQMASGHIVASALHVALHLEIPDRLASGPQAVGDLARASGVQEDGLYRVLRTLAGAGMFEERASRTFASNAASDLLRKGETTLRNIFYFLTDPMHFRVYADLLHSVGTGQPAVEKVVGLPVFEYLARDPAFAERFNNGMTSMSAGVVVAALKAYDFGGINVLVDVAGGHGMVITSILRQYPGMRGVLFDVDHVIAGAVPLIERAGVADRCQTASGDFFTAVPAGGDAYIMKHIIHDWDDVRAIAILKNIATRLRGTPRGRVLLLESVVQPANQPDFGKLLDLEMLVFPGGRERTADEYASLFARAGFELTRIVPTESPLSVIEAHLKS